MFNGRSAEIKAAAAGVLSFISALFGASVWSVIVWLCATVLDYITGTLAAVRTGEWSSKAAREGLWHKAGSMTAVLVAALCDIAVGVIAESRGISFPGEGQSIILPAVAAWYIFTELGSVIENADRLGAPMPEFLRKYILSLREKSDGDEK